MHRNPVRSYIGYISIVAVIFAASTMTRSQEGDALVQCWLYREPVSVTGGLLVDATSVYTTDAEDRVVALDRKNGAVLWKSELGGKITLPIRLVDSTVIVVTKTTSGNNSGASYIRAISKATGITNWVSPLPNDVQHIWSGDERSILVLTNGGPMIAIDPSNGSIKWSKNFSGSPGKRSYIWANWLVRSRDRKTFEVVSLETWKTLGQFELDLASDALASGDERLLVLGDARGNLESISLDNASKNWKYKAGGAISHLILRNGSVIVGSADNFVYSISPSSGNVEWKRRMPGRISSIGTLADTKLALTVVGEKTAYVLDLYDGKFAGRVVLGGDEEFVGYPLAGDEGFIVALTNRGVTAFSAGCTARKAADRAAA